jgi:hypothetical protein
MMVLGHEGVGDVAGYILHVLHAVCLYAGQLICAL